MDYSLFPGFISKLVENVPQDMFYRIIHYIIGNMLGSVDMPDKPRQIYLDFIPLFSMEKNVCTILTVVNLKLICAFASSGLRTVNSWKYLGMTLVLLEIYTFWKKIKWFIEWNKEPEERVKCT